jgi:sugar lactone lactonase YvrE
VVWQYDFDVEKGTIANRRACVTFPAEYGIGDGMDIDCDGNLWVAHYTGWCVGKWDPRTGELLGRIELPVSRVTSCAFGGENYDQLYIVTASIGADKDEKPQPEAGYVFVANGLGVKGRPFYRFGK